MSKSAKFTKTNGKRAYHRQDTATLNRTALLIGGFIAVAVLITMIISFI